MWQQLTHKHRCASIGRCRTKGLRPYWLKTNMTLLIMWTCNWSWSQSGVAKSLGWQVSTSPVSEACYGTCHQGKHFQTIWEHVYNYWTINSQGRRIAFSNTNLIKDPAHVNVNVYGLVPLKWISSGNDKMRGTRLGGRYYTVITVLRKWLYMFLHSFYCKTIVLRMTSRLLTVYVIKVWIVTILISSFSQLRISSLSRLLIW